MSWQILVLAAVLVPLLFCLALVVSATARLSHVTLRALAEKRARSGHRLLGRIAADREAFLLPLALLTLVIQISLTLLVFQVVQGLEAPYPALWALVSMVLLDTVFRRFLPNLLIRNSAEPVLLRSLAFLGPVYPLLRALSVPLTLILRRAREYGDRQPHEREDEEAGEEEIQAYIGMGREEGLIEKDETKLIQSALEFTNTLVREIMTPRAEMVAVEDSATMEQLREVFVNSKFSRLPVYRERIDEIVGVVYARNFLAHLVSTDLDQPITPLINEPIFVPETKRVIELLKDLQRSAANLAMVVNEYGAVTGLVTTEDLVEEIVGEIHDEDEPQRIDIASAGDGSYIVRGGLEIDTLEDRLDLNLSETGVTTVSGWVVRRMGKVPQSGETVSIGSLQVEVLKADRRRINSLRLRRIEGELLDTVDVGPAAGGSQQAK